MKEGQSLSKEEKDKLAAEDWGRRQKGIYELIGGLTVNEALQMLDLIREDIPRNTSVQVPS